MSVEVKKQEIRGVRDYMLQICDWTQLPDCGLSPEKQAEWKAYRQALRDLPESITSADAEVIWPSKPQS